MKFSHKIFIAVFFSTFVIGGALLWGSYHYTNKQIESDFITRYQSFSKVLGNTLTQLDNRTETLMYNAAKYVAEKDDAKGLLSTSELKAIRDDLSMTHIFVVNDKGKFIRSTNEDPKLIPNAFSFCPKYKDLVTGDSNLSATPIIHPHPEPKPYKFLFVPNKEKSRLIEVGVRVDFLAQTLSKALSSDSTVLGLSVFSPKGDIFGDIHAEGVDFKHGKVVLPKVLPSHKESKAYFDFYTKVTSSQTTCCQCDVAGTSIDGKYYYVLRSRVSKGEMLAALASTKWIFVFMGLGNLLLSFILAKLLSMHLVRNIEKATKKIKEIKHSGTLKERVNLGGNDEVAYLARQMDSMLDSIERSQNKLLEAEKTKAKVKVAKQVAHNISSPIIAIEMILPMLHSVPDRLKGILKTSVSDIKNLSKKLSDESKGLSSETLDMKEPELVLIPLLIDEVIMQKKFEYKEKSHIRIEFINRGEASSKFVKLRPQEFKSILSNLINNAVEAMGSDTGRISIECSDSDRFCYVKVQDTGVGIPADYVNRLGKEAITFKGGENRGIGLLHAFEKVESWGGSVNVESVVGYGSVITLSLPRHVSVQKKISVALV